jgi:hypothetical protein
MQSWRQMAGVTLYASLFEPDVKRLDLYDLPSTHRDGPFLLNVRRYLDIPQAVALGAERSQIILYGQSAETWQYPQAVLKQMGWDAKRLQFRENSGAGSAKD